MVDFVATADARCQLPALAILKNVNLLTFSLSVKKTLVQIISHNEHMISRPVFCTVIFGTSIYLTHFITFLPNKLETKKEREKSIFVIFLTITKEGIRKEASISKNKT